MISALTFSLCPHTPSMSSHTRWSSSTFMFALWPVAHLMYPTRPVSSHSRFPTPLIQSSRPPIVPPLSLYLPSHLRYSRSPSQLTLTVCSAPCPLFPSPPSDPLFSSDFPLSFIHSVLRSYSILSLSFWFSTGLLFYSSHSFFQLTCCSHSVLLLVFCHHFFLFLLFPLITLSLSLTLFSHSLSVSSIFLYPLVLSLSPQGPTVLVWLLSIRLITLSPYRPTTLYFSFTRVFSFCSLSTLSSNTLTSLHSYVLSVLILHTQSFATILINLSYALYILDTLSVTHA